jgi:hypothetical protein
MVFFVDLSLETYGGKTIDTIECLYASYTKNVTHKKKQIFTDIICQNKYSDNMQYLFTVNFCYLYRYCCCCEQL